MGIARFQAAFEAFVLTVIGRQVPVAAGRMLGTAGRRLRHRRSTDRPASGLRLLHNAAPTSRGDLRSVIELIRILALSITSTVRTGASVSKALRAPSWPSAGRGPRVERSKPAAARRSIREADVPDLLKTACICQRQDSLSATII